MASSNHSSVAVSSRLSKYTRIPEVLQVLDATGTLKALQQAYYDALVRLKALDPLLLRDDKDVLKLISDQLIEDSYRSLESSEPRVESALRRGADSGELRAERTLSPKSDGVRKSAGQAEETRKVKGGAHRRGDGAQTAHSASSLSRSQNSLHVAPFSSLNGRPLSEFNTIVGAATFPKQKRRIGEVSPVAPGPGSYNTDPDLLKSHSPKAVIPVSGKRIDFVLSSTPGPAYYTPLRHFVAK